MGWIRAAALLALLLGLAAAPADEIRVIELKHRSAEEVLPVIRPLLGREDAVSATGFKLIVRSSGKRLQEIERVLAELDVPRKQLTLTVRHAAATDRARTRYEASGAVRVGDDARVIVSGTGESGGGAVEHGRAPDERVRLEAERRTTTSREEGLQRLRVMDGERAYIRVGQSIPHVQQILVLTGNQAILSRGVVLQDVTTGFDVRPRVRGDRVLLEITPRLSSLHNPAAGLVSLTELTTTVEARLGEWIDLGEIAGSGEEVRRAILASGTERASERRTVLLKVE